MSYKEMPSLEKLRSFLRYEPETGKLFWLRKPAKCILIGAEAGSQKKRRGYIEVFFEGQHYLAHRIIWLMMTGKMPSEWIDHKNGVTSDNRWGNLRECSAPQNAANRCIGRSNTSGFKGVTKKQWGWEASIKIDAKTIYLGTFKEPELAHAAYCRALKNAFGEFARVR